MDGVIADFDKRYRELYNMAPKDAEKHKQFDKFFSEFIATQQFASLDLMQGAAEGLEYLRKANVLTQMLTSSSNEKRHDEVSKQKMLWLEKHGITFYPIIVPGKRLKKNFSNPNSLLIDDTSQNIDQWRVEGGIGILHTDAITTIGILKMYT